MSGVRSRATAPHRPWRRRVATLGILLIAPAVGCAMGCVSTPPDVTYANACAAALDCFLPCTGYEQCTHCLEARGAETLGLIAAYDSIQCASSRCPIVCGFGADVDTCLSCAEHECPGPLAACSGWGSRDYDAGRGEPLLTCYELRECIDACETTREQCGQRCYWDARPEARLAFWKLWALVHGTCSDRCRDAPSPTCESCIAAHAEARGIVDCLDR